MIENIELYEDDKTQLRHLSIEKKTPLSALMTKGANYIIQHDLSIIVTPPSHEFTTYTMNISADLRDAIRTYVANNDVKIRDFWVRVSQLILEKDGEL